MFRNPPENIFSRQLRFTPRANDQEKKATEKSPTAYDLNKLLDGRQKAFAEVKGSSPETNVPPTEKKGGAEYDTRKPADKKGPGEEKNKNKA